MFKNLLQLITSMPDEAACRKYLASQRWPDGKIMCPHCGQEDKVYVIENGTKYKCASPLCYKKFSVTVGTVFHASNVPLAKWFTAVYLVANHKKGISSLQLGRDISVTQRTAWFMIHRIREALTVDYPELLQGVVEIDESFIGGNITNKHKKVRLELNKKGDSPQVHKTGIMGLLERGGNVKLQVLKTTSYDGITFKPIIRDNVSTNAVIITDGFGAYRGLDKEYKQHEIIQHSKDEFVRGSYHTNSIEGFWSQMKRGIYGIYHSVSPKHLQRYCDEFAFRHNTRTIKDYERFSLTLRNLEGRLTYNQLVYNADKKPNKESGTKTKG